MELHHITGREKHRTEKSSIFNAAWLCNKCHSRVGHTRCEERRLFAKTFKYLWGKYTPSDLDKDFWHKNDYLFTRGLVRWINKQYDHST